MDATCTIQDSIHVFNLVHKYVSRILGTYQSLEIGANWVKNAHIPIFPQTILKKGQKLLGKYIEIREIPQ